MMKSSLFSLVLNALAFLMNFLVNYFAYKEQEHVAFLVLDILCAFMFVVTLVLIIITLV